MPHRAPISDVTLILQSQTEQAIFNSDSYKSYQLCCEKSNFFVETWRSLRILSPSDTDTPHLALHLPHAAMKHYLTVYTPCADLFIFTPANKNINKICRLIDCLIHREVTNVSLPSSIICKQDFINLWCCR